MKVNYPELGGVGGKRLPEGAVFMHPSGAMYERRGGKWVLVKKPNPKEKAAP